MSKKVLFLAIQFCMNIVLPLLDRVDLEAMAMKFTGTSPSDCLVLYQGHWMVGGLTHLQRCSQCILQTQLTERNQLDSIT